MALTVLIIFIILYIYLKYPYIFEFKPISKSCQYIKLTRDGINPISYANFIVYDDEGTVINPISVAINPSLASGTGKYPKAVSGTDLEDIVLVETIIGTAASPPSIEYNLGDMKKVSNVTIINRR